MPIIGKNTISGTGTNMGGNDYCMKLAPYIYTAVAGDQVTEVFWYGNRGPGPSVDITVYSIVAGLPAVRLFAPVTVVSTAANQWNSASLPAPVALVAGTTYGVAWTGTGFPGMFYDNEANVISEDITGYLPLNWTHNNTVWLSYSVYALVVNSGPATPSILYPCRAQLIT